tara:strand:- start:195 stop:308 length:114 start_codon:yes stop_codon:yes gene_type:complete
MEVAKIIASISLMENQMKVKLKFLKIIKIKLEKKILV